MTVPGTTFVEITLHIGGDVFTLKGAFQASDATPFLDQWYNALPASGQRQIDALVARMQASNVKLGAAVQDSTPSPSTS